MNRLRRVMALVLVISMTLSSAFTIESIAATRRGFKDISDTINQYMADKRNENKEKIIIKYKESLIVEVKELGVSNFDTINDEEERISLSVDIDVKEILKDHYKNKDFKRYKKYDELGLEIIELDSGVDTEEVIELLMANTAIEYVQPDYKLFSTSTTDSTVSVSDEFYNLQWGIYPDETTLNMNVEAAWVDISTANYRPLIGILDTGIDISHKELSNAIYTNTGEIANNGIDDDGNGYIDDINGYDFANDDAGVYDSSTSDQHGTHIAGIIAASRNQDRIIGVAPEAIIVPLKFVNNGYGYTSDAIEAINYAKQMGIDIINCSFGSTDYNQALYEAMSESNILYITAAGNENQELIEPNKIYPASYDLPNIISVGAYDQQGNKASFSNYGAKVDVLAPGVDIYSTTPNNSYAYLSGTSQAVPFITGVAALLKTKYTDMTGIEIATRIKTSATQEDALSAYSTYGIVDAYEVLVGDTSTFIEEETDPEETDISEEDNLVQLMSAEVSQTLLEQIHFGEEGVNPATGNYSTKRTDFSLETLGFTLNVSRTYNSKDTELDTSFGKGWTFGFEGSIEQNETDTTLYTVNMPDGSANIFKLENGIYTPQLTRSTLEKQADNTYILTTKDQYTYGFNTSNYLEWMSDRNGNTITIDVNNIGKIQTVKDAYDRTYTIDYNAEELISKITDPMNRSVEYHYTTDQRLEEVVQANGATESYAYTTDGYIESISNSESVIIESINYYTESGTDPRKVERFTNYFGAINTYNYNTTDNETTITDQEDRIITKEYNSTYFITKSIDPLSQETEVNYNGLGEELFIIDRYGNKTTYTRDDKGNIISILYADDSTESFNYDANNNLIEETNQEGNTTYYIYTDQIRLAKTIKPLNGSDSYAPSKSPSLFAITSYTYDDYGLVRTITDAEGHTITYTYDDYGYKATETNSGNQIIKYKYNNLGWLESKTTPLGYTTTYDYTIIGQLARITEDDGSVTRYIHDSEGNLTQEITPKLYTTGIDSFNQLEGLDSFTAGIGIINNYLPNGLLDTTTDTEGNTTSFTYDIYANIETETMPNGDIYKYNYDSLNRELATLYNGVSDKDENGNDDNHFYYIDQTTYQTNQDGTTSTILTKYLEANLEETIPQGDYKQTTRTFNNMSQLIAETNDLGNTTTMTYTPGGELEAILTPDGGASHFKYDIFGNILAKWSRVENDTMVYEGYTYNKISQMKSSQKGKDHVNLYDIPATDRIITINTTYNDLGQIQAVYNEDGSRIEYLYDADGRITTESTWVTEDERQIINTTYNYAGQIETTITHVEKRDIIGYSTNDTGLLELKSENQYDINGNLTATIATNGLKVDYDYLDNDTLKTVTNKRVDENGLLTDVTVKKTYDALGQVISVAKYIDETESNKRGKQTTYEYGPQGTLLKEIITYDKDSNTQETNDTRITAYGYDFAGRRTIKVSPQDFIANQEQEELNWNNYLKTLTRTQYQYNSLGQLIKEITYYKDDEADLYFKEITKTYAYDTMGRLIMAIDGENNKTITTYNKQGQVTTTQSQGTRDLGYAYDIKNTYDGVGRLIKETNALGNSTTTTYDSRGNIIKTGLITNNNAGEVILSTATYNLANEVITTTSPNGSVTTYDYNLFGQLRSTTQPSDNTIDHLTTTYQYNQLGLLATQEDTLGKQITYTYDDQGQLMNKTRYSQEDRATITTTNTYDLHGNLITTTNAEEQTTTYTYNGLGQMLTETQGTHTTTYTYDQGGRLLTTTDWLNNTITTIYDNLGRIKEQKDAYNQTVSSKTYNNNHQQISNIDGKGNETTYIYDSNNNLIKTIDPLGETTTTIYTVLGQIGQTVNQLGYATEYKYNERNQLERVISALGEETFYTYDQLGNQTSQTNGNGNTTAYEYNVRNQLIKIIDQDGRIEGTEGFEYDTTKIETYTYYADGNQKTKTDRNGNTTTYEYDGFGRLTKEKVADEEITYTYDENSQLTQTKDITGTTTRVYDTFGRVTLKSVPEVGVMTFTYDNTNNLNTGEIRTITIDQRNNKSYEDQDKNGRLLSVGEITDTNEYIELERYSYDGNGNKSNITRNGNLITTYNYTDNNQLQALYNYDTTGSEISQYTYTYDTAGNQTQKVTTLDNAPSETTQYTYDALGRLKTVIEPDSKTTTYIYDNAGNRLSETVTGSSTTEDNGQVIYQYNNQNHLEKTIKTSEGITTTTNMSYDYNGNMTSTSVEKLSKIEGDPTTLRPSFGMFVSGQEAEGEDVLEHSYAAYTYNNFNQMIEARTGDATSKYQYNAEGYRTVTEVNGETTYHVYVNDKVILEIQDDYITVARNIYGNSKLVMRSVDDQSYYYYYNGHGDVIALLDTATNTNIVSYDYDPFGNIIKNTNEDFDNPYLYSGYQYDSETELYYLNARMYDPSMARFMQQDTYLGESSDPLSLNLYSYSYNNPIRYWDPTGHIVTTWDEDYVNNSKDLTAIATATTKWENATTEAKKTEAHEEAEAIRNKYRGSTYIGSVNNDGYTYEVNEDKTEATLYKKEKKKSKKKSYNAVENVNNAVAIELEVNARDVDVVKNTISLMKEEDLGESLDKERMLGNSGNKRHNVIENLILDGVNLIPGVYIDAFLFGFEYDSKQNIYYSRKYPLQRYAGYFDVYDDVALKIGLDIMWQKIVFEYDKRVWNIELWKGQYYGSIGAEIGIYTGEFDVPIPYIGDIIEENFDLGDNTNSATVADELIMEFVLKDEDGEIFHRNAVKHWWLTGFMPVMPYDYAEKKNLILETSITLKDSAMKNAFTEALDGLGYVDEGGNPTYQVDGNKVSFEWK